MKSPHLHMGRQQLFLGMGSAWVRNWRKLLNSKYRQGSCLSDPTVSVKRKAPNIASVEEAEDDLSGTQFVCETVIRSLTLDAAPDHNPPCRQKSLHSECPRVPPASRALFEL